MFNCRRLYFKIALDLLGVRLHNNTYEIHIILYVFPSYFGRQQFSLLYNFIIFKIKLFFKFHNNVHFYCFYQITSYGTVLLPIQKYVCYEKLSRMYELLKRQTVYRLPINNTCQTSLYSTQSISGSISERQNCFQYSFHGTQFCRKIS